MKEKRIEIKIVSLGAFLLQLLPFLLGFIYSDSDVSGPLHGGNIIIFGLICLPIGLILAFINIWQLEVKYRRKGLVYSDFVLLFLAWVVPIILLLTYLFELAE